LNFLPSFELFFFSFIDICYFSQVLNFTSVELNRYAKQATMQATVVMRFPAKKNTGCPKAPPRKNGILYPLRVVLALLSPSSRVCTDVRTYADVTTKFSRIDRLPNLLSNGALLARYARGLRCDVHSRRITQWNHKILSDQALQLYSDAIAAQGTALNN